MGVGERERRGEGEGKGGREERGGGREGALVLNQQVCDPFYTCLILFPKSNTEWKTLKPATSTKPINFFHHSLNIKISENYFLLEK